MSEKPETIWTDVPEDPAEVKITTTPWPETVSIPSVFLPTGSMAEKAVALAAEKAAEIATLRAAIAHRDACDDARRKGCGAALDDKPESANPYASETDEAECWTLGWVSGQTEVDCGRMVKALRKCREIVQRKQFNEDDNYEFYHTYNQIAQVVDEALSERKAGQPSPPVSPVPVKAPADRQRCKHWGHCPFERGECPWEGDWNVWCDDTRDGTEHPSWSEAETPDGGK